METIFMNTENGKTNEPHKFIFNLSQRLALRSSSTNSWSEEIFAIGSVLKTNPWTYKIKELNGETIIESFYEKELLLSKL